MHFTHPEQLSEFSYFIYFFKFRTVYKFENECRDLVIVKQVLPWMVVWATQALSIKGCSSACSALFSGLFPTCGVHGMHLPGFAGEDAPVPSV